MSRRLPIVLSLLVVVAAIVACVGRGPHRVELLELPAAPASPEGYAPLDRYAAMAIPADNPLTAEAATLGEQLYHDTRLSGDGSRSCYSCHVCEKGLTDGLPVAIGASSGRMRPFAVSQRSFQCKWRLPK